MGYILDQNGDPILDQNGDPISDGEDEVANPVVSSITKRSWVNVATNVTKCLVHKLPNRVSKAPGQYLYTYRMTGEAAPTDKSEGILIFQDSDTYEAENAAAIDVYIWATSADGQTRTDA